MSSATSLKKPILVGMNNPQGNIPFFPHPPGCSGHRLWQMLSSKTGCFRQEYLDTFDRINMIPDKVWSAGAALAAQEPTWRLLEGRTVVLCGRAVPVALGYSRTPWSGLAGLYEVKYRCTLYFIPHPSGMNRWYNDPANRDAVASLLSELYKSYRHSVGLPLTTRRIA